MLWIDALGCWVGARWVNDYKSANERISANCKTISETLLIVIKKKKIYSEGEFEENQKAHRDVVRALWTLSFCLIHLRLWQTLKLHGVWEKILDGCIIPLTVQIGIGNLVGTSKPR